MAKPLIAFQSQFKHWFITEAFPGTLYKSAVSPALSSFHPALFLLSSDML